MFNRNMLSEDECHMIRISAVFHIAMTLARRGLVCTRYSPGKLTMAHSETGIDIVQIRTTTDDKDNSRDYYSIWVNKSIESSQYHEELGSINVMYIIKTLNPRTQKQHSVLQSIEEAKIIAHRFFYNGLFHVSSAFFKNTTAWRDKYPKWEIHQLDSICTNWVLKMAFDGISSLDVPSNIYNDIRTLHSRIADNEETVRRLKSDLEVFYEGDKWFVATLYSENMGFYTPESFIVGSIKGGIFIDDTIYQHTTHFAVNLPSGGPSGGKIWADYINILPARYKSLDQLPDEWRDSFLASLTMLNVGNNTTGKIKQGDNGYPVPWTFGHAWHDMHAIAWQRTGKVQWLLMDKI